jgi:hypothetical protein
MDGGEYGREGNGRQWLLGRDPCFLAVGNLQLEEWIPQLQTRGANREPATKFASDVMNSHGVLSRPNASTDALAETTMSDPRLPAEVLDHVVDHLHDTKAVLRNCSLVSKSWIHRTYPKTHFHPDKIPHDTEHTLVEVDFPGSRELPCALC